MATITEDYVSFETSKLLKEKGFNGPCNAYWFHMIDTEPIFNDNMPRQVYNNKSDTIEIISCPTLQMAIKWLREVHEIHCVPMYRESDYYEPQIFCLGEWINDDELDGCFSYEGACEASIKYCLENLI